jgi:hypothetical protein
LPKMLFNTNTPYVDGAYGTAPITLNNGGIAIKTLSSYGTGSLEMGMIIRNSNATPIRLGLFVNNGSAATSTNAAYVGPITNNDLVLTTNGAERVRISSATTEILNTLQSSFIKNYSSQVAGATSTIFSLGHETETRCQWNISNFHAGTSGNNHFSIVNGFSNINNGINIGSGSTAGASGGGVMVLNNANGNGSFVTCGTSSCNGALYINALVTKTVPAGWGYTPTGSASVGGGSVGVSLATHSNIWVNGSVYCSSDSRLKNIVGDLDTSKVMNLLNITPKWYTWKSESGRMPQLGLIAQDLVKNDLKELTMIFDNESLKDDHEGIVPDGKQLAVAYDRLPLILLEIIKKQQIHIENLQSDIEALKKAIETISTYNPLKKHIDKST